MIDSPTAQNGDTIEQENTELLSRLAGLQQEKWNLEEKVTQSPEVIKLFSCSTQLSTKFILLINVKMPTIVVILTIIIMPNTTYDRLKARNFFICHYFSL